MADPVGASQAGVDVFAARCPMNASPVQPLNGRSIRIHELGRNPPPASSRRPAPGCPSDRSTGWDPQRLVL